LEIKEFFKTFPAYLVVESLEKELKTRLERAQKTVEKMEKKYGMNLKEFEESKQLEKLNYSWEAEKDYIDWDKAESEMKFCKKKLKELQNWKSLLLLQNR